MIRPLFALATLVSIAVPASAATYSARTSVPVEQSRIAVRDMLWTCGKGTCAGTTANSRPLVLCQSLAKEAGRIDGFTVDGREISADQLERCNASAKSGSDRALANAR